MHWDISLCVFNFLWKLEEQKFPQNGKEHKFSQNGMANFWKFCAKLSFAYWKRLVKRLRHEQFLLNQQFSAFQPPTPSVKWVKILEWLLSFYMFSGTPLKIYHICRKKTFITLLVLDETSFLLIFLIEKASIIK